MILAIITRFDFCSLWTLTSSPHLPAKPTHRSTDVCLQVLTHVIKSHDGRITPQNLTCINPYLPWIEYTWRSARVLNIIWIKPRTRCIRNVCFSGRVSGVLVGEDQWRHLMCSFNTVQIHTLGAKHPLTFIPYVQTWYHRQTTGTASVKRAKITHAVQFSMLALLNMQNQSYLPKCAACREEEMQIA